MAFFSRTSWVRRHQKGKLFWILLHQEIMGWQWHQLDHMQIICTLLQTDNHASKLKETYLYSAYYEPVICRHSGMAHVNEGSRSFTCHPHVYPQVEWTIPAFTPNCRAWLHFSWYSFPVVLRVGGWVGLGDLVKYWGGLPTQRWSPILVLSHGGQELNGDCRVTSQMP